MTIRTSVKLRPGDEERVRRVLRSLSPKQNKRIYSRALRQAALLVQKIASEDKIVRGRRFAPPLRDRLTARTGTLARSIAPVLREVSADVGTDLVYGGVHEEGARPFLQPALADAAPKFPDIFARVLEEELRRA